MSYGCVRYLRMMSLNLSARWTPSGALVIHQSARPGWAGLHSTED